MTAEVENGIITRFYWARQIYNLIKPTNANQNNLILLESIFESIFDDFVCLKWLLVCNHVSIIKDAQFQSSKLFLKDTKRIRNLGNFGILFGISFQSITLLWA